MAIITLIAVAANAQNANANADSDRLLVQLVMDGDLAFVEGSIYSDLNGDCLQGATETGLAGWQVVAECKGQPYHVTTDAEGNFTFAVAPGKYTISIADNPKAFTASVCSSMEQKVTAGKGRKVSRLYFPVQLRDDPLSAKSEL